MLGRGVVDAYRRPKVAEMHVGEKKNGTMHSAIRREWYGRWKEGMAHGGTWRNRMIESLGPAVSGGRVLVWRKT